MRTSEENIRQLLEMLDNPDTYTEQEIQNIINRDEDTRETYRLMVETKRSSRQHQHDMPLDVDNAWQRFNQKLQPKHDFSWKKSAASFIGVFLVSGIAFAAIWSLTPSSSPKEKEVYGTSAIDSASKSDRFPFLGRGVREKAPSVVYDNIPLEKMLPEIAAHYGVEVTFLSEEVRGFRFRFVWNPQQGIDQVISDLNQFERLTVTRKDSQIVAEGLLNPSEK